MKERNLSIVNFLDPRISSRGSEAAGRQAEVRRPGVQKTGLKRGGERVSLLAQTWQWKMTVLLPGLGPRRLSQSSDLLSQGPVRPHLVCDIVILNVAALVLTIM